MGTLLNQPVRKSNSIQDHHIRNAIADIRKIEKEGNFDTNQALKLYEILVHERKNDLYQANGDIWDEQIAGIGEILTDISEFIQNK